MTPTSSLIDTAVAYIPSTKVLMAVTLAWILICVIRTLKRRNASTHSVVDLDQLLIGDDGKMSKAAFVMYIALALTTWGMVLLFLRDKMTEGYFGIYVAAWITPVVTVLIVNRPQPTPPSVTNKTTIEAGTTINAPGSDP